jgi:hypothetical protein
MIVASHAEKKQRQIYKNIEKKEEKEDLNLEFNERNDVVKF